MRTKKDKDVVGGPYERFPKNLLSRIVASDEVNRYPVDESQTISNAGDAVVYEYYGRLYEVITWNEFAVDHEPGSITVTQLENKDET